MQFFRYIVALMLFALSASSGMAQSYPLTGNKVPNASGGILASGTVCFSGSCANVTNGVIAPQATLSGGVYTVGISDASGNQFFLLPGVTVSGPFRFDALVITATQTLTIAGVPFTACQIGAQAIETDVSPNPVFSCTAVNGRIAWLSSNSSATPRSSGFYSGAGAPIFYCSAPCVYTRVDAAPGAALYSLSALPGVSSNNWVQQAIGPPGPTGNVTGNTSPAADTSQYIAINPANNLPGSTQLGQGFTLFDNGNTTLGGDIGKNTNVFGLRLFATGSAQNFVRVFGSGGSRPTGDNSFNVLGDYLSPSLYCLFGNIADHSGCKFQVDNGGNVYTASGITIGSNGLYVNGNTTLTGSLSVGSFNLTPSTPLTANQFFSLNYNGNLPSPSAGYAGGLSIWNDGGHNSKSFLDFNASNGNYGGRFAQQSGWRWHFGTVGSGSATPNDISEYAWIADTGFRFGNLYIDPAGNVSTPGNISAGIAAAGDALTPTQFVPLFQAKDSGIARIYRPSGYQMSYAGYTLGTYGDSNTLGQGSSNGHGFAYFTAQALGATLDNQGIGGDIALDLSWRIFNHENNAAQAKRRFTAMIGTNDDHIPTSQTDYQGFLRGGISWLATVSNYRVDAGTLSGTNWANDTTFSAVTGKTTSTNGATLSGSLTTYGEAVYVWYQTFQNQVGTTNGGFSVSVDGGAAVSASSAPNGGQSGNTGGIGVKLLKVPVAAGSHSFTITSTAAAKTTIVSIGTPSPHSYYDSPAVAVAGVIPENGNVQPLAVTFSSYAMDVVRDLQADGLDVRAVDNRPVLQNGLASLYADQYHMNDAGHLAESASFVYALQLPPDTAYVSRATPKSGSSIGTPGDVWSDGSYTYSVAPDSSLRRAAAGTTF